MRHAGFLQKLFSTHLSWSAGDDCAYPGEELVQAVYKNRPANRSCKGSCTKCRPCAGASFNGSVNSLQRAMKTGAIQNIQDRGFYGLIDRREEAAVGVEVVDGVAGCIGVEVEAGGVADGIGA